MTVAVGVGFRFNVTLRVPALSAALDADRAKFATGVPVPSLSVTVSVWTRVVPSA